MASEILASLHIIFEQDVAEFIAFNPNPERVNAMRREELLLGAQTFNIAIESSSVFPLANLICHHLSGTGEYDFVDKKDASAVSEWSSRSDVHEVTVIQNTQSNDQVMRDFEFRMMQSKMEFK